MPGPPAVANGTNEGDNVFKWLEESLEQERRDIYKTLEWKHQAMIAEFRTMIDNTSAGRQPSNASNSALLDDNETGSAVDEPRPAQPVLPSRGNTQSTEKAVAKPPGSPMSRNSAKGATHAVFAHTGIMDTERNFYRKALLLIDGPYFEVFWGCIIVISAILMAMEMQYRGIQNGMLVEYRNYDTDASALWPWADDLFAVSEWILGSMFTVELLLKLLAQGRFFFIEDIWNWIDMLIVGSWLVTAIGSADVGFNPALLRTFRLMRLLRLLKLLGMISIFDSLYLMTTAIKGSLSVLLWAVLVLTVVEMLLACLLQAMVEDYIRAPENRGTVAGMEVYRHFGSFARSMLTMFEMTLGNWIIPCRALVENVSEWYMLFFLFHKFIIGFSVVSVITGVFIQETFKVATSDDLIMLHTKARELKKHESKMRLLFESADADGDGTLDRSEFIQVMDGDTKGTVKKWLSSMGLDVEDTALLFDLINGGDGELDAHELVIGAGKLKGAARSIDLNVFMSEFRECHRIVKDINRKMQVVQGQPGPPAPTLTTATDNWPPSPSHNGIKGWFGYA